MAPQYPWTDDRRHAKSKFKHRVILQAGLVLSGSGYLPRFVSGLEVTFAGDHDSPIGIRLDKRFEIFYLMDVLTENYQDTRPQGNADSLASVRIPRDQPGFGDGFGNSGPLTVIREDCPRPCGVSRHKDIEGDCVGLFVIRYGERVDDQRRIRERRERGEYKAQSNSAWTVGDSHRAPLADQEDFALPGKQGRDCSVWIGHDGCARKVSGLPRQVWMLQRLLYGGLS